MINYDEKITRVRAIFKGQNGSLGYNTNEEYPLNLRHTKGNNISITTYEIMEMNAIVGECEYESMSSFLKNWDNIRIVND
jgi:hypothetical protein